MAVRIDHTITVEQLPDDPRIAFVSDYQEVETIKSNLGEGTEEYDSFFLIVDDGEYVSVWGMEGIVPLLAKHLDALSW